MHGTSTKQQKRDAKVSRLLPWLRWRQIWVLDTEFQAPMGERQKPVCLCALEILSGWRIRLFFNEPLPANPFEYEPDTLFVGFVAAAEWKTFLELGWELPGNIIDLNFEFMRLTNGGLKRDLQTPFTTSHQLTDACKFFGLERLDAEFKEGERENIIQYGVTAPEGVPQADYERRVLDYCEEDVDMTADLFKAMYGDIPMAQGLVRGAYSKAVAHYERNGLPIDAVNARKVVKYRNELRVNLAEAVEAKNGYGVLEITGEGEDRDVRLSQSALADMVRRMGLSDIWQKTATGQFTTSAKTLKDGNIADAYPAIRDLYQWLKTKPTLNNTKFPLSSDGFNRTPVFPFQQKTGRNSPSEGNLLALSKWMRFLIQPKPGWSLIACDVKSEELALGACYAKDEAALAAYYAGVDPYLDLAVKAGYAPPDATKETHKTVRGKFKVVQLAGQYGAGGSTLAKQMGCSELEADILRKATRDVQKKYWDWSDGQVSAARKHGIIETCMGWQMRVYREVRPKRSVEHGKETGCRPRKGETLGTKTTTLINFPIQAAGAEILRIASLILVDQGYGEFLCAPHHDAIYAHCPAERAEEVKAAIEQAFVEAGREVTGDGVTLKVDSHIYSHPTPYEDEDGVSLWKMVSEFLATKPEVSDEEWEPLYSKMVRELEAKRKERAAKKRNTSTAMH